MRALIGSGLAICLVASMPLAAFAFEDQWQPSTRSLSQYIADGYVLAPPTFLRISPFDKTEVRYFLTKNTQIAQCSEIVTSKRGAVVDKQLACLDLVAPFTR